jgi:hypothetical protein
VRAPQNVRAGLWHRLDIVASITACGTAGSAFRMLACQQQTYLPSFGAAPPRFAMGQPKRRKTKQRIRYANIMQGKT